MLWIGWNHLRGYWYDIVVDVHYGCDDDCRRIEAWDLQFGCNYDIFSL